jgi:glycosyltransferase involved in cell wall biosynthesis
VFTISVIVSTYNRPDALCIVLDSLCAQTDPAFEVIVADDGSGPETARAIAPYLERVHPPIRHVWHEDLGFRVAAIRNRACAQAKGDYVVYLDGDCLVRPDFVAEHRRIARAGCMVTGSRVLVSRRLTERIIAERLPAHAWSLARLLGCRLTGGINRWITLVPLPGASWRRHRGFSARRIRGCNLAAWRSDIVRINGFDEAFAGWGHEDLDFVGRLHNAGLQRLSGACAATVLHLWHPQAVRASDAANRERAIGQIASGIVRAGQGLDLHAPASAAD